MPIYEVAPNEVRLIVDEMMDNYHQPLRDAGVQVDLLFAKAKEDEAGDKADSPVKLNGYPCAAIARIIAYKLRVQGHGDCEIVIDGDAWDEYSEDEKRALIDHELEHFECKLDKDGLLTRDDLDRPKLTMRKHDHQFGWFDSIARRHGKASFEVKQAGEFVRETYQQQWLAFGDDTTTAANATPVVAKGESKLKVTAHGRTVEMTPSEFVGEVAATFRRKRIAAGT